jgi:hypothetical protein
VNKIGSLALSVQLEYLGVALAQHLRDHVVGQAAGAEPGREGMSEFVHREMRHASPLQRVVCSLAVM